MAENHLKNTKTSSVTTTSSPEAEIIIPTNLRYYDFSFSEKKAFYETLKKFLKERRSLREGEWIQFECGDQILNFTYGKKKCEVSILYPKDFHELKSRDVATLDIYLHWRQEEFLSLQELQRVQDELRFLELQNKKLDDCFNLAKNQIVKMNIISATLQISCDDVFLTFRSGTAVFNLTVIFDEKKGVALCYITREKNGQRKTEIISG